MEERRIPITAEEKSPSEPVPKSPRPAASSLDSAFEEILKEREAGSRSVSTNAVEIQLQTYLSEHTTPKRSDPLEYWKEHGKRFPSLVALATKYLCAPCSSVDSERLFSDIANILDEKRNRLSADRVEMLVFLKKNLNVFID